MVSACNSYGCLWSKYRTNLCLIAKTDGSGIIVEVEHKPAGVYVITTGDAVEADTLPEYNVGLSGRAGNIDDQVPSSAVPGNR